MRELEAVTSFVYANRRLQAGDYFTARTTGDARVLVATRKAKAKPAGAEEQTPPAAKPQTKKPAPKAKARTKPTARKPAARS